MNISPKGLPSSSFAVFGPNRAAYIDATGSASETISHIYENGRVTILFNSFGPNPRILRLFCTGRAVEIQGDTHAQFQELVKQMNVKGTMESARAVIVLDIWKVQTSCGYGVPIATPDGFQDRATLFKWGKTVVDGGKLPAYWAQWNSSSLDGLPGVEAARRANGERWLVVGNARAWARRIMGMREAVGVGFIGGLALGILFGREWALKCTRWTG